MRVAALVLVLLCVGCGGSSTGSSATTPSASRPSGPPTVQEDFTALPCDPNTTVGMEGCAEHRILRADAEIDRLVQLLWDNSTAAGQAHLADAQSAWQTYRKTACLSESDSYAGGSLAPVVAGRCELRFTIRRSADLRRQLRSLTRM